MPTRTTNPGDAMLALARRECQAIQRALANREDVSEGIHAARKALRRLRSLLAMAGDRVDGLDAPDRTLQRLCKGLSALRDAHAATVAARRLEGEGESASWQPLVEQLLRRRDTLLAQALARDPDFARRRRAVARLELALQRLDWTGLEAKHLRAALQRSRKRAAKAGRRADSSPTPENIHRWRRRARRLRMQLESTRTIAPALAKAVARPSLRRQLSALHKLGDELGWRQDMQVLLGLLTKARTVANRPPLLQELRARIEAAG